ncbi:MAG TPA: class I SAM-dependent methyltransferase [Polyangia bacterium]|nr:class I SAM-dependent methyltransferase [Polyangia bacterium]
MQSDAKTVEERLTWLSTVLDRRYLTPVQARRIYRHLCLYEPPLQRIVEIGTYCGTGAILLAAMVEPWGGHVTTIDLPWTGTPNRHFTKTVDDWIRELKVENVTVVRRDDGAEGWLQEYLREQRPALDFVYIDGGHKWLHTCAQFAAAYAALRPGGWLCFDDCRNETWPDVGEVWHNVVCQLVAARHRFQEGQLGFAMRG